MWWGGVLLEVLGVFVVGRYPLLLQLFLLNVKQTKCCFDNQCYHGKIRIES